MSAESNLQNMKLDIIQWVLTLEDTDVIEKIKDIQMQSGKDWSNMISESEQESIRKGTEDADLGQLNPQSKARKIYEQWL